MLVSGWNIALLGALACGGSPEFSVAPPPPPPPPPPVAMVTGVTITPPSSTVTPGGHAQFDAMIRYSDGSSKAAPVAWTTTGGTITASGLFSAGINPGQYEVVGTEPSSGMAGTSPVTILADPPPSASFVPWLRRDWKDVPDKAAAQLLGFGVEGSPAQCNVPPEETWDLIPNPLWGKVIRFYGNPAFNKPGFSEGCTAVHGTNIDNAPTMLWVRQFIRFSKEWSPLPGTGYKVMFFRFAGNGRQQIVVAAAAFHNRTDAPNAGGGFVLRSPPPRCPGWGFPSDRGIPFGLFELTFDCATQRNLAPTIPGDGEWWEFVMGYLPAGDTLTSVWAYRQSTVGGEIAPGTWTVDVRRTTGGTWPLLHRYEMGVNRNGGYNTVMSIDWGPYDLVDGARYANPFAIPGVPPP